VAGWLICTGEASPSDSAYPSRGRGVRGVTAGEVDVAVAEGPLAAEEAPLAAEEVLLAA
jgi:hypothetical protein